MLTPKKQEQQSASNSLNDLDSSGGTTMSPPAFGLEASPYDQSISSYGNQPIQKKDPEDDVQAENIVLENPFTRMATDQQLLIDRFSSDAQRLAGGWGSLREMHTDSGSEMKEDDYRARLFMMTGEMHDRWYRFSKEFRDIERIGTDFNSDNELETKGMMDDIYSYKDARKELGRQLNSGSFPRYMKEMVFFHRAELGTDLTWYVDLLEDEGLMEFDSKPHKYKLETLGGISVGAGEVVQGGASIKGFRIIYENELGLSWKVNIYGASAKAGGGVSGSPIEANIESPTGLTGTGTGSSEQNRYFTPDYFGINMVSAEGAEYSLGAGEGVGMMSVGKVLFDLSGTSVKFGTAVFGEIGAEGSLGVFVGGETYDTKGLPSIFEEEEEAKQKSKWMEVINAVIHFPTESANLDDADESSLNAIVDKMILHQAYFPGDLYNAKVTGYSSPRWTTAERSAKKNKSDTSEIDNDQDMNAEEREMAISDQLNEELAKNRAANVANTLHSKLQGAAMYDEGDGLEIDKGMQAVNNKSHVRYDTKEIHLGGEDDILENDPRARAVHIRIKYLNSPKENLVYKAGGSKEAANMIGGF